MKKYLSNIIIGCLGICVGFALCYFSGVSPAPSKTGDKGLVVTITQGGSLYLSGTKLDLAQLSTSLKKQAGNGYTITIHAGANTNYQRVVEVVDACKAAGITRIAMRTATP